ncbi:Gamma-tubulin complex component 5 [Branchiostoma belcheri]|nr:Gamma-tubulin complex component 5 [Branchiostoma belcheri]
MFNNSTGETTAREVNQVECIVRHLRQHSSYDKAEEACSMYTDIPEPELRKQLHILMANLAVVDMLAVCHMAGKKCLIPTGSTGVPLVTPLLVVLNSAINPVASIIRTPDLRQSLRQDAAAIYRALVTMVRGNRVNPLDEQTP